MDKCGCNDKLCNSQLYKAIETLPGQRSPAACISIVHCRKYKTSRVHSPRDATYERGCPLNRNTDTIDSGIDGFRESHQRTYHNLRLLRNAFCKLIGIGLAIFHE